MLSLALWLLLRFDPSVNRVAVGNYFALSLSLTPLIAGVLGFKVAKHWGGAKSLFGKATLSLSTGLTLWAIGNVIWAYYNIFKHVAAPYPSLADFGYGLGVLFWILCTVYLGKALGVPLLIKNKPKLKWGAVIFALLSIGLSYYLFIKVARGGSLGLQKSQLLNAFFDLYYPLTDVCSLLVISFVSIVSARYVGGLLRLPVYAILTGVLCSYIYDLTFSYATTKGTYANGQFSDIFLLAATALLSFSIALLDSRALKLRGSR